MKLLLSLIAITRLLAQSQFCLASPHAGAVFQRHTRQILLKEVERSRQEEEILTRNATGRYMAGNPPASVAHALGKNGMIVTERRKVTIEPSAPTTPSLRYQKPRKISVPNSHSVVPRKKLAPESQTRDQPKTSGLWPMNGAI